MEFFSFLFWSFRHSTFVPNLYKTAAYGSLNFSVLFLNLIHVLSLCFISEILKKKKKIHEYEEEQLQKAKRQITKDEL